MFRWNNLKNKTHKNTLDHVNIIACKERTRGTVEAAPLFYTMNYKDKRWRDKRKAILKRDKYQCQECKRYGKMIDAVHVHHIYPVEFYPEYRYCSWNLTSLCNKCHNAMHDRETHELTTLGMRLKEKTSPQKFLE